GIDIGGIPRRQETIEGTSAQTRSERVLEQPNEPPLTEGHTSGSGEGKLEENIKLTDIVPTPHDSPLRGGYTPESDELSLDEDLAQKLYAEELAKEEARQEQERYNLEKPLELQR
nr:hypothetical protein [Tanacetum cinerariifolium]